MNVQARESLMQIFDLWRTEDRQLQSRVSEIRRWMAEVAQFGIPYFGEAATRLRRLRRQLAEHFNHEREMLAELGLHLPAPAVEFKALNTQANGEHTELLEDLDELMERLDQLDPPFPSWQHALQEFEQFVQAVEQHENDETQQIGALITRLEEERDIY
jgi:chromosome segregation ATPase